MKNQPFAHRLVYAWDGLRHVWRWERSFRTQVLVALSMAALLIVLRPGWLWAALIVVCIALVLALEMMNSALEYLIDHVHPDVAPAIKHAKDAAAGAVLLASCGAAAVGLMMLVATMFG